MRNPLNSHLAGASPGRKPISQVAFEQSVRPHLDDASTVLKSAHNALRELNTLLEDYGPMWFTPGHHERAEAALRDLDRLILL
jgi:hypothetical protein